MTVSYKNWRIERDAEGLAWLWFDRCEAATNTLSGEALEELERILQAFDGAPPKGLVIGSAKPAGFIAGADIHEFTALDNPEAARALIERGWRTFNRLAAARYPTLALVRGHCLGGGLELALACRYRVVVDEPGTRLALPEVMLGIVPGWGGMQRLPALIGPALALDLMLTGKGVDARRARRIGLADECVPPRVMENAARMLVVSGRAPRRLPFMQRLLNGPLKAVVAGKARKQAASRVRPQHYPAPFAIIDIWARHDGNALAAEREMAGIFGSQTAKNLVRVFFLQERLKGFGKDGDGVPRRVHVVGAGVMGGDIAAWCALRGMTVTLQDQSVERIAPAIARAAKLYDKKFRGDAKQARFTLDRLIADPQGHGAAHADVIIEAIFENLEAKRELFRSLEARARPDAVLATNTSSLRLEDIAGALDNPARLVGIHFFNPVAMMPLVEVVEGAGADPQALKRAAAFVRAIDKLPQPVKSAPGFLVNAVRGPYMLEALRCVEEGIAPEVVDEALLAFGMPMGPVELVDTVGLDIAVAAGKALAGDAAAEAPQRLLELVAAGRLGKKSGQGYYRWEGGKAVKGAAGSVPDGLAERILTPLLRAAQRCVDQGVVSDAELADAGVIFGTGFAPFTGGPLNFLRQGGFGRRGGAAAPAAVAAAATH